jgi:NAD(P)-dependent dehydrogenase (short-subunit alcohol dehydrogenase family)
MNLLVTGATGLIGAGVSDRLRAEGYRVHALCRGDSACRRVANRGLRPALGDRARPADWADILLEMDGVVHTAATFDGAMAEVDAAFLGGRARPGRARTGRAGAIPGLRSEHVRRLDAARARLGAALGDRGCSNVATSRVPGQVWVTRLTVQSATTRDRQAFAIIATGPPDPPMVPELRMAAIGSTPACAVNAATAWVTG